MERHNNNMKLNIYGLTLALALFAAGCTPPAETATSKKPGAESGTTPPTKVDSKEGSTDTSVNPTTVTKDATVKPAAKESAKVTKEQPTAPSGPKNTDAVKSGVQMIDDASKVNNPDTLAQPGQNSRTEVETKKVGKVENEAKLVAAQKARTTQEKAELDKTKKESAMKARSTKMNNVLAKADRANAQANFVGTWKLENTPMEVKAYAKFASEAKKKGRFFKAPESLLTVNADGTFKMTESVSKASRLIQGSYTFADGTLVLTYASVNGKPPVAVSDKAGKTLVISKEKKLIRTDGVIYLRSK